MHDPLEGVTSLGTIKTGAHRDRVSARYRPVLEGAISAVRAADPDSSLYVYGSVATGMARLPESDVDLLTVGLSTAAAGAIARRLSRQFADLSRAVDVAAAQSSDFAGETDEAYGGRVFLRHYCVHLSGPDLHSGLPQYAADVRAARGFNGDIARQAGRWRAELNEGCDPGQLGRRIARKSLLAVAGLVSVHDKTWTTDRARAAARWAETEPSHADELLMLLAWSGGESIADRGSVAAALDGIVAHIGRSFATSVGLWDRTG